MMKIKELGLCLTCQQTLIAVSLRKYRKWVWKPQCGCTVS